MNIEEITQAAMNGDISAINTLGDFFTNDVRMNEAAEWYERSAQLGDHYGRYMGMLARCTWALSAEGVGVYGDALENWQRSFYLAKSILDDPNSPNNNYEGAKRSYPDILAGIGINLYFLERKDEAFETLSLATGAGNEFAAIVLGLYYQSTITEDTFVENFRKSIPLLEKVLAPNLNYSEDSYLDQMIIFLGHRYLAETYRIGFGETKPNVEKAYNCLLNLQSKNLKNYVQKVQNELRKYSKGLFGGYKYQE